MVRCCQGIFGVKARPDGDISNVSRRSLRPAFECIGFNARYLVIGVSANRGRDGLAVFKPNVTEVGTVAVGADRGLSNGLVRVSFGQRIAVHGLNL